MRLSDYINPLYLSRNKMLEMKNTLHWEKYVKAIVFEDFLKEDIANKLYVELFKNQWDILPTFIWDGNSIWLKNYQWDLFDEINNLYNSKIMENFMTFFYDKFVFIGKTKTKFPSMVKGWLNVQSNTEWNYMIWHQDFNNKWYIWNTVLYISTDWTKENEWFLELWYKKDNEFVIYKKIEPIFNRFILIIWEENKSWHRISEMKWNNKREAIVKPITTINELINK